MPDGYAGVVMRNLLVILLAGGAGERLSPLTRNMAKPAVPFGGTIASSTSRSPTASTPVCAAFSS